MSYLPDIHGSVGDQENLSLDWLFFIRKLCTLLHYELFPKISVWCLISDTRRKQMRTSKSASKSKWISDLNAHRSKNEQQL